MRRNRQHFRSGGQNCKLDRQHRQSGRKHFPANRHHFSLNRKHWNLNRKDNGLTGTIFGSSVLNIGKRAFVRARRCPRRGIRRSHSQGRRSWEHRPLSDLQAGAALRFYCATIFVPSPAPTVPICAFGTFSVRQPSGPLAWNPLCSRALPDFFAVLPGSAPLLHGRWKQILTKTI